MEPTRPSNNMPKKGSNLRRITISNEKVTRPINGLGFKQSYREDNNYMKTKGMFFNGLGTQIQKTDSNSRIEIEKVREGRNRKGEAP